MITNSTIGQHGQLGNQLFQLAFLHAQARRLKTRAFVNGDAAGSALAPFHPERLVDVLPAGEYAARYEREIDAVFQEPEWGWNEQTMRAPDGCDFRGYFQSAQYFADCADDICAAFRSVDVEPNVRALGERIAERVAVHVRLGYYVQHPTVHTNLQLTSYYQDALTLLGREFGPLRLAVFSDDIPWCYEHLHPPGDVPWCYEHPPGDVIYSRGLDAHLDLWLMSLCEHHVIANSSFSWWAAWLAGDRGGRVVAPARWFGPDGPPEWAGIYCNGWMIL